MRTEGSQLTSAVISEVRRKNKNLSRGRSCQRDFPIGANMERDQTARSPDWGLGGDRAAVAGWLGNAARADLVIHAALNATLIRKRRLFGLRAVIIGL